MLAYGNTLRAAKGVSIGIGVELVLGLWALVDVLVGVAHTINLRRLAVEQAGSKRRGRVADGAIRA